jgi:hypothetical protein
VRLLAMLFFVVGGRLGGLGELNDTIYAFTDATRGKGRGPGTGWQAYSLSSATCCSIHPVLPKIWTVEVHH